MDHHPQEWLLARIQCDNRILLQRQPVEAPLDPGHWRHPGLPLMNQPPRPHPALCGLDTTLAASVQTLMERLNIDAKRIRQIAPQGVQRSPAWHPGKLRIQVVDIRLEPAVNAPSADTAALDWASAEEWLDRYASGALLLNPLSQSLLVTASPEPDWANQTHEEPLAGLQVWPIASHTLPPAQHTNAFVFGTQPRLLVDPSPCDEASYQALSRRLPLAAIEAIFLTHHHPDHHQQANRLAREHDLPVLCSADTAARIPKRFGEDYWQGLELRVINDGEQVSDWLDQPVLAHAVPGHDQGQLALAPTDASWMIVGDLIQGIGTVVIAEPEGHMGRYLTSLRRVLDLAPKVVLPSHGQAMASTYRIAATLAHREWREEQIRQLHLAGQSVQQMLEQIYADVDRRLWGLARMNIASHLRHLQETGRLDG